MASGNGLVCLWLSIVTLFSVRTYANYGGEGGWGNLQGAIAVKRIEDPPTPNEQIYEEWWVSCSKLNKKETCIVLALEFVCAEKKSSMGSQTYLSDEKKSYNSLKIGKIDYTTGKVSLKLGAGSEEIDCAIAVAKDKDLVKEFECRGVGSVGDKRYGIKFEPLKRKLKLSQACKNLELTGLSD